MKYAILLLAHKNESQIVKLIETFDSSIYDFYIHLDKKSRVNTNSIYKNHSNVTILDEHFDIELFSFEMILAELALIKQSQEKKAKYSYFILLSGQDFPIISPFEIDAFLSENYPKDFVDITPIHKGNWVYNSFNKSNCFKSARGKLNRMISHISTNIVIRMIMKVILVLPLKGISYLLPSPLHVLEKEKVDMYGGSQWWILSDETISKVLYYIDHLPQNVFNALKRVGSPDETFFQTCIMNSCDKGLFKINAWTEIAQNNQTYVRFNSCGHPDIIVSGDFDKIIESNKLFARKFDFNVDSKIIEMIVKRWKCV